MWVLNWPWLRVLDYADVASVNKIEISALILNGAWIRESESKQSRRTP
jgi:hypothetical protein